MKNKNVTKKTKKSIYNESINDNLKNEIQNKEIKLFI